MREVLIIGPGAIGLTIGAALRQAGHEVTFAARQGFDTLRVAKEGAPVRVYPAQVVTNPETIAPFEWVMLCVKAHQVATAAAWLKTSVGPETKLCVLQNGVEHHERVAPFIAPETAVLPVVIDIPAARLSPGNATWRAHAFLDISDSAEGSAFADLFADSFITARKLTDLKTRAWRKLCVNAPGGAMLALTAKPMRVFHEAGIADIARAILRECVAVGRAEGANLPDSVIDEQMQAFMAAGPEESNSMLADHMAGLETEWDARNGVIVRKGRKHNIPTPVSDIIVPLLAAQTP
jgi:2-dehydropantoate 2-reductase